MNSIVRFVSKLFCIEWDGGLRVIDGGGCLEAVWTGLRLEDAWPYRSAKSTLSVRSSEAS